MKPGVRDLPNEESWRDLAAHMPDVNVTSTESLLLFMRTFRDIYTEMESRLSQFGITQGRFVILKIMYRSNKAALTPSELAQIAGVTRGTVTGLIDGLERDGLIERRHHSSDRRMITVHLTAESLKLMDSLLPHYFKGMDMLMAELSAEEQEQLASLMKKIRTGLDKVKHQWNK